MAIEDYIPNVFGGVPQVYQGLLGADETAALQKRANIQGLLGAAATLAQGMSPQGYRRSALQNILSAAASGYQAAGGAMQQGLQDFGTRLQLGQNIQKTEAINKVLADPQIANNPAMKAWVMSNPDKALEMFVQRQNIADFMAREGQIPNQPVQQPAIAPQQGEGVATAYPVPAQGQEPQLAVSPVTAPSASAKLEQQIKQADLYAKYWSTSGNDPVKAKEYQAIANDLRKQQSQTELASNVKQSLGNINPLFQSLVDTLEQNAPSMTATEIQSAIMDIRKKNSEFKVSTEENLRKEYNNLPEIKEFTTVETAFKQINSALSNPSAANDLAAATKFMKLLDPGSVVRESELGMAMAATGAIDRIGNYLTRLQNGQVLNPEQRADFKRAAQMAFDAARSTRDQTSSRYIDLASSYNVDPNNVVLRGKSASKQVESKPQSTPSRNSKGWVLSIDANGNRAYVSPDGMQFEEVK
jgi:hypothetical protein